MPDNTRGQNSSIRLKLKKGDIIAAAAVTAYALVLAAVLWLPSGGDGQTAVILQDGTALYTVDLQSLPDGGQTFYVEGQWENVIRAENGCIWVESSTCPSKSCVHTGKISSPGRSIVCLPNRMEIKITGDSGVDAVIG